LTNKYLSLVFYVSDGVTKNFPVPFPYIKREYVEAYRQAPDADGYFTTDLVTVPFNWVTTQTILLHQAVPQGERLLIRRNTYAGAPLVDFQDTAIVVESELDLATMQALHVAQEAKDMKDENLELIRKYFQLILEQRAEIDEAREVIEEKAEAASESAYKAKLWAEQTPGIQVEPGEYSARHYSDQAKATGGEMAQHVAAYDPHMQYLRKDQTGDGIFELDANEDVQIRQNIQPNSEYLLHYVDAWGNVALRKA
jgi:hypothetical protein